MFARQQAAALMVIKGRLEASGVALVAIGSGSPEGARRFVDKFGFAAEMYVNPDMSAYRAFGLERGIWKTLGPASLVRGIRAMMQGFRQGRPDGDLWQQGGVFVLGPGEALLFQHRNASAGDHADLDAVLAVVVG
jgi:hypothetical protein